MTALRLFTAALVLFGTSGCAGKPTPPGGPGGDTSTAAVERFLQFAGEERYVDMGWVFGTESGPVMEQWARPEVEQRMYAIARVLAHDAYVIGSPSSLPGRIGRAERLTVTLQSRSRSYEVPFISVRGSGSRWYVEQVDLEAITGRS